MKIAQIYYDNLMPVPGKKNELCKITIEMIIPSGC